MNLFFVNCKKNNPPGVPSIPLGPSFGKVDRTYGFSTSTTDPEDEDVSIRFDWGDGDTSDWSPFVKSEEDVTMNHSWSTAGIYNIKAQAKDLKDTTSEWSKEHQITISREGTLKWRFKTGGGINNHPAIAPDNTIYFYSSGDTCVYALRKDGTLKWRYKTGYRVSTSPAIGTDGTIYFGSNGYLNALNPDGTSKWRFQIFIHDDWVYSSPAIGSDGTIYFGAEDWFLYALNPDGRLKWAYRTEGGRNCSPPAISLDGTIYFGSLDCHLHALNPDGTLKWKYKMDSEVTGPAIGSDGTIYCGTHYFGSDTFHFYAINPDGTLKWRYKTDGWVTSDPVITADGSVIFVEHWGYYLLALKSDGTEKWEYKKNDGIITHPIISSDGIIYFGVADESGNSTDYYLIALNQDCTIKWHSKIDQYFATPTIGMDSIIYFCGGDGYFYAFYGSGTLGNTPWPKFKRDLRNTGRVGGGK